MIKKSLKFYILGLFGWISFIYYMIYCKERSYYDVMAIFWGLIALVWIWDIFRNYTLFERSHKYDKVAYVLIAMPFIYPLVSICRGLTFPMMTSPLMPSSVVVYTMGILLLYSIRINLFLVLMLCHWSIIGLSKTYSFDIPEDFILAIATIPALYLFFRQYYLGDLKIETKPSAKYINRLLIAICIGLAILIVL